jgi:phage tail sheath gpL-like
MAAIGNDVLTRITGFNFKPGDFATTTANLPVSIAITGEINTSEQGVIELSGGIPVPKKVTNIQQVANLCGWGSPIYQACKILFPNISGIPVYIYPQLSSVSASAKILQIEATGTATSNGTHTLVVCGRESVGGQSYGINIVNGDTSADIHDKIADKLNQVLGSPVTAISTDYYAECTSKWKGLTANEINISINTNGNSLGITYDVTATQVGAGTPDVTASLDLLGNKWIPCFINGYGLASTVITQFQNFNGHATIGENPATGRYLPTVFKPLIALTGFISEDPSSTTDALLNEMTIGTSPAPLSKGLSIEAAANHMLLWAKCLQNTPELDIIGAKWSDMPTPDSIGVMADWQERDAILKKGCSTVDLVGTQYEIQDPVTTYHPIGETPAQFRYIRNIGLDWNVYFTYKAVEESVLLNKVIVNDGEDVASNIQSISPNRWRAVVIERVINDLVARGLIVDAQFSIDSLTVQISTVNPDRFETAFDYKRSGVVRQSDTEVTGGFNLGTLTVN